MAEWNKTTIGELCDSISNTYHAKDAEVVLVNTSDVLDGKVLSHNYTPNRNLKGQFKKTFIKDDILYSEIRPANRRFAFIDFDDTGRYIASTKLMVIRARKDKIRPKFLFAILKSNEIVLQLQHLAETRSGTFPQITFSSELAPMEINLPDLETQDRIVTILDAVDGKLNANSVINNNLQAQAQAIYEDMFSAHASDAWAQGTLSDIAEIIMGQSPSGDSYNENGNGMVFFQGRAEFGTRFPTIRLYTTEPKRIAKENDVLMSVRAPVGDLNIAHEDCCIGRGLGALRAKTNHQSFLLYTLFALQPQLNVFNGEGTVFGSINRDALNRLPLVIPFSEVIDRFEKIVAPMDAAIRANHDESCRLIALRDTLLPKLMGGEIDVSEVEI